MSLTTQDIERIALTPSDEDRAWFPDIAGNGDAYGTLREIWANFRDESIISQYLSPNIIRKMGLFQLVDDEQQLFARVAHPPRGDCGAQLGLLCGAQLAIERQ